jgi:MFS family permease
MTNWMLRGLVLGGAMVVVRLFQGTLIDVWQTQAALISIVLLALFLAGVVFWGVLDGRADAAANPDPDRRGDLALTWLLAGLVAGVLSGAVTWLIAVFYKSLYVGGLINELTTFAAFTALLVFLGAITGVAVGRYLIDRAQAYTPHHGGEEDRADTDVFAAVRSQEADAEGGALPEAQSTAVATAERAEHSEAKTERIAWPPTHETAETTEEATKAETED